MSICQNCQAQEERPTTHAHLTRHAYRVLIAALREVSRRYGYALAVHGSLKTDIDLIAVPWRDSAPAPEALAAALRTAVEAIYSKVDTRPGDANPTKKPCGRLSWVWYLGPHTLDVPYIDLSVFPPRPTTTEGGDK